MSQSKKPKKEKRELPLRSPGAPVNNQTARPSQLLFSEVKRLEDLENQNAEFGRPNINSLDAQTDSDLTPKEIESGRPNILNLDAQKPDNWTPNTAESGHPNAKNLDVLTPKTKIRTPNSKQEPDVLTPKENILDAQNLNKKSAWGKYEKTRSTARLALRPNEEILRKFKIFCAQKDLGLTEFFEISGLRFIELDAQSQNDLDVLTPLDDRRLMMMFKCKPFIINLYLAYNAVFNEISAANTKGKWSARWTPRDDEAGFRYNDTDPQIVELGIIQTQMNKGFGQSKIQTFKYYTDEIEKVLTSGVSDEMLVTILQYHRKVWTSTTKREINLSFLVDKGQKNE